MIRRRAPRITRRLPDAHQRHSSVLHERPIGRHPLA